MTNHDLERRLKLLTIQKYTNISKVYFKKLISYSGKIEVIEYPYVRITFKGGKRVTRKREKGIRRDDSTARTRNNIYRLVEGNIGQHGDFEPVFLTLTFKENVVDLKYANLCFKKFIMRFNYFLGKKLAYVFIPEFQKRGAVHYHGVIFNLPFTDKSIIQDIWSHGFTRIETPKNIRNISAYISKYLSKQTMDNRFFGQRILMTSRDLKRPLEIFGSYEVDSYLSSVKILDEVVNYKTNKSTLKTITCKL
jgi:hypothetical protein